MDIKYYNKLCTGHLTGKFNVDLSAKDIEYLTEILIGAPIGDKYDVAIDQELVKCVQLKSGLHIVLSKVRKAYHDVDASRVEKKVALSEKAVIHLKEKGVKRPTKEQINGYCLEQSAYKKLYASASQHKEFILFLEETRGVLQSREDVLREVSVNIRSRKRED